MQWIDAHVHIWTADTAHYPLAAGYTKADMQPTSFTPEELFRHCKPVGVTRGNLIQMSFYGFDNSYMLDMIRLYPEHFVGTAVIDPTDPQLAQRMADLKVRRVRAFRIYPGLDKGIKPNQGKGEAWLAAEGYARMFATAAKLQQAISCLINVDALPELERMCKKFPQTPVIIDHLCRIGVDGKIRDADVEALCKLAEHPKVMVKIGAFYALGHKKAPYTDLAALIRRVLQAFTPQRCMWESDCPYQVVEGHRYADSIDLIRKHLDFLSDADRHALLRGTAEAFFFRQG